MAGQAVFLLEQSTSESCWSGRQVKAKQQSWASAFQGAGVSLAPGAVPAGPLPSCTALFYSFRSPAFISGRVTRRPALTPFFNPYEPVAASCSEEWGFWAICYCSRWQHVLQTQSWAFLSQPISWAVSWEKAGCNWAQLWGVNTQGNVKVKHTGIKRGGGSAEIIP